MEEDSKTIPSPSPSLYDPFEISPSIVHFGSYKTHKLHTQIVNVTNVSKEPIRLNFVTPKNFPKEFSLGVPSNKSFLVPGGTHKLKLTFLPTEFKYACTSFQIICSGRRRDQVRSVPIHAYPVAHGFSFPRKIDFGPCPLGRTQTKRIEMKCKVPVDFGYEIVLPCENVSADFKISSPSKGTIPASGSAFVEIQFTPLKLATVSFSFMVRISQYDFKPLKIHVTGSSLPGIVRKMAVDRVRSSSPTHFEHCAEFPETLISEDGKRDAPTPPPPQDKTKRVVEIEHLVRRGAGPLDGGATVMFERHRRQHLQRLKESSSHPKKKIQDEQMKGGLRVPALHIWEKSPMRAMEFVMTQSPGKLKPKDLKNAIAERRAQRKAQIEASKTIRQDDDDDDVRTVFFFFIVFRLRTH